MRTRSLAWVLLSSFAVLPPVAATSPKLSPGVVDALAAAPDGRAEMLVLLAEQADLSAAEAQPSKAERGRYVHEQLRATARRTQAPLLAFLAERGAPARSFWGANFVHTRGDLALAEALAARGDVRRIEPNPRLTGIDPVDDAEESGFDLEAALLTVGPNIAFVNADDVWAMGFTGQNVVIAGQDTGYEWDHPALQGHYRGWNGSSADHNYDWHDAIHSGGGSCGANSSEPCDDHSHGTHTMGTMVGDDASHTNQIGMAPGAKWIGCRNMDQGNGTPTTYIECFEWFIAPTNLAGNNPDPALAPHSMNNSWGCPTSEGCNSGNFNVMRQVVENVREAGILVVLSAGNSGSGCSTVNTPAAIYDEVFSVGATSSNSLASFSSRGPVTVDGSNRRKPDISAPGVNIRSSVPGGGYEGGWDGTSMAGPHVAGLAALLISANPAKLEGNVDGLEELIREGAVTSITVTTPNTCGGIPATQVPNNHFGWGRIDALASVQLLQGGLIFRDGFRSGDTTDWSRRVP